MSTIFHLSHNGRSFVISNEELIKPENWLAGDWIINESRAGRMTAREITDAMREQIAKQDEETN